MATTKAFSTSTPLGSEKANTLDTIVQDDKVAIDERYALEHYSLISAKGEDQTVATAAGKHKPGLMSAVLLAASAPTVGPSGSLYYDTALNILYISNGTNWTTYSVASPVSGVAVNYSCYLYNPTTYGAGAYTKYSSEIDPQNMHTNSGLFSFVTIPVTGIYLVTVQIDVTFLKDSRTAFGWATSEIQRRILPAVDTYYPLIKVGQNYQEGTGTVGNYNKGSGSASIAMRFTATDQIYFYADNLGRATSGANTITATSSTTNTANVTLLYPTT